MMRALTLHQPWASLVAMGLKPMETRGWAPPASLEGAPLAIHAGSRPVPRDIPGEIQARMTSRLGPMWRTLIPYGAIVARCVVADVYRVCQSPGPRDDYGYEQVVALDRQPDGTTRKILVRRDGFGDFRVGRYLWVLEDVRPLRPTFPAKGRQGLWEIDLP